MMRAALRFTVLCVAALVAGSLFAQAYPTRPVRIVSPYAAGGGNDTLSRIIGEKLGEQLGQRVIVENRPGAGTVIGTEVLAKSPPDGYTIILLPNSFATNPAFYPKLPYDTLKDFAPIAEVAQSPQMLVVHPSFPPRTVKELVAFSKANPGEPSYGTTGNGSPGHLAMLLLSMMTGARMTPVPYKGTAPAVADLMGGHIPLMMSSMLATLPQVRAGRLRIIAITTAKRSRAIPEVPTIGESGVPGYEATLWYGFLAPARTPDAIVKRLNAELGVVMKDSEVVQKLEAEAVEAHYTSPEAFGALIKSEVIKWAKVINAAGVKATE
jgi:tripartite-type tricarboxylate transporter receptor subunit TctC